MKKHAHIYQTGLNLVELMVAMAIGLILMLGATGVLLTNQQAFSTTEGLSGIQDSSRVAIDMLSRDIRAAGSHPCTAMQVSDQTGGNASELLDLLKGGTLLAPSDNPGNRDTTQGAIRLVTLSSTQTITGHVTGSAVITANNDLAAGDSVLACGGTPLATYLLKVADRTASTITTTVAPQTNMTGATISSGLSTRLWYIGTHNDRLSSLYLSTDGGNPVEMVDGVVGLNVSAEGVNGIKIDLVVCSKNADVRGLTNDNNQLCGSGRIQRNISTIVQRRAA